MTAEDLNDLEQAIDSDPTPTSSGSFGDNVGAWVGKMVSKAATGGWQIGVGAADGLLGNALRAFYGAHPWQSRPFSAFPGPSCRAKTDGPVPRIGVRQTKPDLLKAGSPDSR